MKIDFFVVQNRTEISTISVCSVSVPQYNPHNTTTTQPITKPVDQQQEPQVEELNPGLQHEVLVEEMSVVRSVRCRNHDNVVEKT
jgi:hypothetical protein